MLGRGLLLGLLVAAATGCETLQFYGQAARGQLGLLLARTPVEQLLANPELAPELRAKLAQSQRLLDYLEATVGLEIDGRYRSYVALDRDAVVYNLVAAPAYSVEAHRWCYPIAGCAPYRGYFRLEAAEAAALRYRTQGFTTYVGRVPAYSTLGWFEDPLLSTFIHWPEARLLDLLAHELAHSKLWLKGDVPFNEAFASFVGAQAVRDFYGGPEAQEYQALVARQAGWRRLTALLLALRSALADGYRDAMDTAAKQRLREQRYAAFRTCYAARRQSYGEGRFDAYVARVNDAALAALATYEDDQPLFAQLFAEQGRSWKAFFAYLETFNALPESERTQRLTELRARGSADQQVAHDTDRKGADDVQCRALASHAVDGHLS